jgi:hypothetical protein
MTDEKSRKTEDEQPEVEGHLAAWGPEKSLGPHKANGPEGAL